MLYLYSHLFKMCPTYIHSRPPHPNSLLGLIRRFPFRLCHQVPPHRRNCDLGVGPSKHELVRVFD